MSCKNDDDFFTGFYVGAVFALLSVLLSFALVKLVLGPISNRDFFEQFTQPDKESTVGVSK